LRYGLIGDSLYSFPILPAIRRQHPGAKITFVIDPVLVPLLEECPYIDAIIPFDRNQQKVVSQLKWLWDLKKQHYDLAIVLNASFQAALFAYLIGAKQRWGFDSEKRGFLLTKSYRPDPDAPQLLKYRKLLEIGGFDPGEDPPQIWSSTQAELDLKELLRELSLQSDRPQVVFHVGASDERKIWPAEHFIATANALGKEGSQLIFVGGPADRHRSELIIKRLEHPAFNLAGRINLAVLAELYRRADLAINNDSGPMHLAAFVGCPVLGIFDSTTYPVCWKPWGPDVTVFYPIGAIKPNQIIDCARSKIKLKCKPIRY
jgi:lipopolysaccharide heptosyltransferase II